MSTAANPLLTQHCQHATGAPLTADEIAAQLVLTPGWTPTGGKVAGIERSFSFTDFHATMAFVNALAFIAHREDHHPDLQVGYNRCTVHFSTHSVGGLSINDFICAAHTNALLD
jgi:4a-hydroxytetrahydrobiopterin dehydratase